MFFLWNRVADSKAAGYRANLPPKPRSALGVSGRRAARPGDAGRPPHCTRDTGLGSPCLRCPRPGWRCCPITVLFVEGSGSKLAPAIPKCVRRSRRGRAPVPCARSCSGALPRAPFHLPSLHDRLLGLGQCVPLVPAAPRSPISPRPPPPSRSSPASGGAGTLEAWNGQAGGQGRWRGRCGRRRGGSREGDSRNHCVCDPQPSLGTPLEN